MKKRISELSDLEKIIICNIYTNANKCEECPAYKMRYFNRYCLLKNQKDAIINIDDKLLTNVKRIIRRTLNEKRI